MVLEALKVSLVLLSYHKSRNSNMSSSSSSNYNGLLKMR